MANLPPSKSKNKHVRLKLIGQSYEKAKITAWKQKVKDLNLDILELQIKSESRK